MTNADPFTNSQNNSKPELPDFFSSGSNTMATNNNSIPLPSFFNAV